MANVQFDIDGVLANFSRGFERYARTRLGVMPAESIDDTTSPIYQITERAFGAWHQEIWDALKQDRYFWSQLPSVVDFETWVRLDRLQRKHDIYFTTHRMGVAAKQQTAAWLRAHGVSCPTVLLVRDKGAAAIGLNSDYSIEDKYENALDIRASSPTTESFLVNRPHNLIHWFPQRVNTVLEFIEYIESKEGK